MKIRIFAVTTLLALSTGVFAKNITVVNKCTDRAITASTVAAGKQAEQHAIKAGNFQSFNVPSGDGFSVAWEKPSGDIGHISYTVDDSQSVTYVFRDAQGSTESKGDSLACVYSSQG